jgi:glycosyltransferase involved in cell wall biosynthesis
VERRILLLLTDLEIGGTPTVVRELAVRLHKPPEVLVHVAGLGFHGPVYDQIVARGLPATALDAYGPTDFGVIKRLVKLISEEKFDTVLSFLVHANTVAAVASHYCKGVRFLQSIQTTQEKPGWHWLVQRFAADSAEAIIVPSQSVATVAHQRSGVPYEKIFVIHNGVETPKAWPTPPAPSYPHRIVFVGRLDPVKRIPDLIDAMSLLRDFARLEIWGEGKQRRELELKIEEMGLDGIVKLCGQTLNAAAEIKAAEVLVLPSEAEGFGMVLIEAMALGVPVVATNAPGIKDIVRNGANGLTVPVGAPAELAAAIRRMIEDEPLRQSMVMAAWAEVRRKYSWDGAIDEYRRILRI